MPLHGIEQVWINQMLPSAFLEKLTLKYCLTFFYHFFYKFECTDLYFVFGCAFSQTMATQVLRVLVLLIVMTNSSFRLHIMYFF